MMIMGIDPTKGTLPREALADADRALECADWSALSTPGDLSHGKDPHRVRSLITQVHSAVFDGDKSPAQSGDKSPHSKRAIRFATASLALLVLLAAGCASRSPRHPSAAPGSSYRPSNVYRASSKLPSQIRRVAVLPVSVEPGDWPADEGRTQMEPVLYAALGKIKAFELAVISPEQVRQWTGKGSWSAAEILPADFFQRLQEAVGCEAVLFCHLRPYHAYKPLVIGWTFQLVDVRAKSILWSVDEIFDSSEAPVAKAAEAYGREHLEGTSSRGDSSSILNSPSQFSQYTLSALLATLPTR